VSERKVDPQVATVDRAINQVLEAEREARDAVALCRAEALKILAAAEEDARRTARRTECRITLVHRIADRAVDRALNELRKTPADSESRMLEADVHSLVNLALDELVEEVLNP